MNENIQLTNNYNTLHKAEGACKILQNNYIVKNLLHICQITVILLNSDYEKERSCDLWVEQCLIAMKTVLSVMLKQQMNIYRSQPVSFN